MEKKQYLILFDGLCHLCSGTVQFLLKRDHKDLFRFVSLQSELGKNYILQFDLHEVDSVIVIFNDKAYMHTDAIIQIGKKLHGIWYYSSILFSLIPKVIRHAIYIFVARNRYYLFGKRETCWLPNPAYKHKFLV